MKNLYILVLLVLTSCSEKAKGKEEIVVKVQDAVAESIDPVKEVDTISFNKIISEIKIKSTPLIDATNFDSFIDEDDYKKVDVKALKLEKIYPNFNKESHHYRAINCYRIELSKAFYSVVVTILKGDHEMESVLINYDSNGDLIDSKVISYDEIAEGQSRIESKIEENKLTVNNILWIDEKKVETASFQIKANGKIEPISQEENLIDSAIQQLNLEISKVNTDLLVTKVMPNNPKETIIVIPEYVDDHNDEYHFELNSHIIVVNNITGKIIYKYFESSETNGWVSDAVVLSEISIDTAPYIVAQNTRAFGVRVFHYGMSKPNPYSNRTISLFVKSGDTLKKVLHNYDVEDYGGEWDTQCAGESTSIKNTLIMSEEKTNAYFDIIVKSTVLESKTFVDENGECDEENKTSSATTVLQFNGKEYLKKNT
ncbi:small nuclear ribonucleoprotein (snRNP)-like protein [Aquimarina sp. EL_43]|uniref:hypothetical protein n=1 Tax=unclassified Aquimarina TaxID=2627091 RepID=UPI0018C94E59|nr:MULTISPECIES: hypothetical protein [unclassified Aquimarina]MBG6130349.1 small nuclear ribonucleoprotein (snRNP)-like protein [Aquimarina sp. EL_35]MBG6149129.1 small nuclear ribonucleoprotein (snRNP)-like protein [Aquimarina sp. EL_32]MBG6168497.1 small nuclear ribonucleoprotein (snRNP)-like protein [Aquimarina sp. EL_43]